MPASYVVFDLLEMAGTDLRRRPYLERRACL
jgi:ATP-dependent DNA ligase